jgi:hypothetical protein
MNGHGFWRWIFIVTASVVLVSGFALAGTLTWWMVFPREVVSVSAIRLLTPIVNAGGTLMYETDYCKSVAAPARVTRTLRDSFIMPLPPSSSNVPVGCGTSLNVIDIPRFCNLGTYHLDVLWQYDVNPLRTVSYGFSVGPFEVVP